MVGPWQTTNNSFPVAGTPNNPLLMTDGSVIVQLTGNRNWFRLTPDITGSYVNGTWSPSGLLPAG